MPPQFGSFLIPKQGGKRSTGPASRGRGGERLGEGKGSEGQARSPPRDCRPGPAGPPADGPARRAPTRPSGRDARRDGDDRHPDQVDQGQGTKRINALRLKSEGRRSELRIGRSGLRESRRDPSRPLRFGLRPRLDPDSDAARLGRRCGPESATGPVPHVNQY